MKEEVGESDIKGTKGKRGGNKSFCEGGDQGCEEEAEKTGIEK